MIFRELHRKDKHNLLKKPQIVDERITVSVESNLFLILRIRGSLSIYFVSNAEIAERLYTFSIK